MKNSWGCMWGDAGYFQMSWAFNQDLVMMGLRMDGHADFENDITQDDEPECIVPQDSNNSDHCKKYNEFDKCIMCNSGQDLVTGVGCKLKNVDIEEDEFTPPEDEETKSEDIFIHECTSDDGRQGVYCPAEPEEYRQQCFALDGMDCGTFLLAAKDLNLLCTRCPIPGIENCRTQSGAKCISCAEGYSASPDKDVCLQDICSEQGQESTEEGSCVTAADNCSPGQSTYTSSGLDE